jgi:hypothetical protein
MSPSLPKGRIKAAVERMNPVTTQVRREAGTWNSDSMAGRARFRAEAIKAVRKEVKTQTMRTTVVREFFMP